ncbi:hypothetical protein ACFQX7_19570 [Luedemannella flava]
MLLLDSAFVAGGESTVHPMQPPPGVPEVFRFLDWPGAFHNPAPWTRVVTRELVVRAGLPFHPGWHQDVPFTFALLVAAQRIALLRRVCYFYRTGRPGSITAKPAEARCRMLIEQSRRVYEHLDSRRLPPDDPLRGVATQWLVLRGFVGSAQPDLPAPVRRAIFAQFAAAYRRHGRATPAIGLGTPSGGASSAAGPGGPTAPTPRPARPGA